MGLVSPVRMPGKPRPDVGRIDVGRRGAGDEEGLDVDDGDGDDVEWGLFFVLDGVGVDVVEPDGLVEPDGVDGEEVGDVVAVGAGVRGAERAAEPGVTRRSAAPRGSADADAPGAGARSVGTSLGPTVPVDGEGRTGTCVVPAASGWDGPASTIAVNGGSTRMPPRPADATIATVVPAPASTAAAPRRRVDSPRAPVDSA